MTRKPVRFDETAIPLRKHKRPEWCEKSRPCDFDEIDNYCPHRECRAKREGAKT